MNNKYRHLVKTTAIVSIGKMSSQLTTLLLLPIYTFFLTPQQLGTVDLITTTLIYLAPTLSLQIEWSAFRSLVDARKSDLEISNIITNVLAVLSLCLLVSGILLFAIYYYFNIPFIIYVILILTALIFANTFLQFARGLGKMSQYTIATILTSFVTLFSGLLFVVVWHQGVGGALSAIILANTVSALYLGIALRIHRYILPEELSLTKQMSLLKYSMPLVPEGVAWWGVNSSSRAIISSSIGVAANGIYAISSKYASILTSVFNTVQISWTESATMHIKSKDRDIFYSRVINESIQFFASIAIALIGIAPIVLSFAVDSSFAEAGQYIPIVVAAAFFYTVAGLYSAAYIALNKTKQVAFSTIIAATLNIGLAFILIQGFNLYGVATASLIAYAFLAFYRHMHIKKHLTLDINSKQLTIFIGLIILSAVLYYLGSFQLAAHISNILLTLTVLLIGGRKFYSIFGNQLGRLIMRRR